MKNNSLVYEQHSNSRMCITGILATHLDESWINYFILGLAKILKLVISKMVDLDSSNENPTSISGITEWVDCHRCSVTSDLFLIFKMQV